MNIAFRSLRLGVMALALMVFAPVLTSPARGQPTPADPRPSWNDGASKRAIVDFVTRVTREGGPDFVPIADRIATFDNDGTLWCEQPVYTQAFFAFDRVKQLAAATPEFKVKEPYRSILEGDQAAMARFGSHEITVLLAATHAGITTDEFSGLVRTWLDTAQHPRFHQLFKACVYQP